MTRKLQFAIFIFAMLVLVGPPGLQAQGGPVYKPGEYPAPRYPQLKANYTIEDLLPIAREVVRKPYQAAFLKAGYNIQKGDKALIVVPGHFDNLVIESLIRAIR